MGGRRTVTFDNWRGGEHGSLGPRNPPPGTFHGLNVLVFADGSVGPRSGFKRIFSPALGTSGYRVPRLWASSRASWDQVTNARHIGIGQSGGLYTKPFDVDLDAPNATYTDYAGTITSYTLPYLMPWVRATPLAVGIPRIIIGAPGDKLYTLDPATRAVAALAGTPGAGSMVVHGSRLLVSSGDQYLRWSDPNALGTFGALNFAPIGPDYNPICGLFAVQDRIIIAKTDGTWWMLTGTPGVNETVRRVYDGLGIRLWHQGIVTPGGTLWFCPDKADYPVQFTGSGVTELRHLSEDDRALTLAPYSVVGNSSSMWTPLGHADDAMMLFGSSGSTDLHPRFLLRRNGAWTRHSLPQDPFGYGVNGGQHFALARNLDNTGIVLLWATNTSEQDPGIYSADFELERPGFDETNGRTYATGDYLDNGVAMPTLFEPPLWWSENGDEVRVGRVVVEMRRWDLGGGATAHFDLVVKAFGRRNAYGPVSSQSQSFDKAAGSVAGDRDFAELYFGDQGPGPGFQLSFSGMRGVSIDAIHIELEVSG